jgi:hypothetical protein
MPQATRLKQRPQSGESQARTRYEDDLFTWVKEQVALLRAGRTGEIDPGNIAEELSDVGAEQYNSLESAFVVLLQHLLKWDYQPKRRSRSWENIVEEQRIQILKVLKKNPGLKPHIDEAIADAYRIGRLRASSETNLDKKLFPVTCPYSFEEIMNRSIARNSD